MNLNESTSTYAGSNMVRTIASFGSNTYHFATYSDTIISRIISGSGTGILKNGSGTLTLSASNTYTGNATISAGVMSIINTGALPGFNTNGRFAVTPNATLAVYNAVTDAEITTLLNTTNFKANAAIGFDTTSGNRTYSPAITNTSQGALGVTKLGPNTLTITSNVNTYTGPTLVIAGTLATSAGNRIPDSSPVTILSGATMTLGGAETLDTIAGAGTLNCQSNNITLNSNNNSTFSGTLTSTANSGNCIYKQGNNTITLSGATVGVAGPIRMDTGGMTLAGGTSFIQNRTSSGPRDFQMALNAGNTFTLNISGGASLSSAGCMFGENNGGTATVNLLSGGTWNSGSGGGQSWMAGLSSILNVDGGAYSAGLFYIGGGPAETTSIINLNSGTINLTNSLIWQGGGRCVFNLNGGTATFANFGQGVLTDNTFNFNGGTFETQNGNYNYNYSNVKYLVKSRGAIFSIPSGFTTTLDVSVLSADSVSTGGGIAKNGAGTLSLGSVLNTFTGQFSANEGTTSVTTFNNNNQLGPFGANALPISVGSNNKTATILFTNTAGTITTNKSIFLPTGGIGNFDMATGSNLLLNGIITGGGTLMKSGPAVLQFGGANNYSGGTFINGGLTTVRSSSAFGTGPLIFMSTSSIRTGGGVTSVLTNAVSLCAEPSFPSSAGEASLTFAGPTTIFGSTKTLNVGIGSVVVGTYLAFTGSMRDNGNGYGITKTGTGTLILSGNNTYSGNTTINNGFLVLGHENGFGTVGEIRFTSNTTGTLLFGQGVTKDISSRIKNNTFRIKIFGVGQEVIFTSLSSSNTGGLTITGSGNLVLSGSNNTFMSNAATNINNGGTLTYAGTHRTPAAINISNAASVTTGVVTISGSLTQTASPAGTRTFSIAENTNTLGTLNVVSGAVVNLSGGLMMGGNNTNPTAILNMFGGYLNTRGSLWPCGNSVINMYNGTLDTDGVAIYHGGGGSTPNTNMTSTINVSGGLINTAQLNLGLGQLSAANTITNLVSGTLSVTDVADNSRPNNNHTFYFDGGILNIRATSTFPALSSVVRSRGAILDIGGTVTTSSIFSDGGGGGGFTKLGSGTFGFNAINTYTGTTTISAGILRVLKKISGTGSDASFSQADFTPTTLTVTFVSGTPPSIGNTYKLFSGATQQTYNSVTLVNYNGTASYNSTTSTLTINT